MVSPVTPPGVAAPKWLRVRPIVRNPLDQFMIGPARMPATPTVRRGARLVAALASGAVLLTSGVGYAAVHRYAGQVSIVDAGTAGGALTDGQPLTMLVVANDDRAGLSAQAKRSLHLGSLDYGAHTDTMLLVHLSSDGQHITAVSLPRDTLVTVPAWTDSSGVKHKARKSKLNAAYSLGGPKLMVQTVELITGVTVDHYAEINFSGFLRMVDALGGVEVCLAHATKDKNSGLNLPAGKQTVNGPQALAYVRARYIDPSADIGRMKRQQKFIGAMAKKALSGQTLINPVALDSFLSALASSVKTDSGLGPNQMLDLVNRFKGINPAAITMLTVPLGAAIKVKGIGDVLTWNRAAAARIFAAIRADRPLVDPVKAATPTVPTGSIHVRVLNGTTIKGQGSKAATDLANLGFRIEGAPANALTPVGAVTIIRFDDRYTESVKTIAAALPGAKLVPVNKLGNVFEVTIGTEYVAAQKVTVKVPAASSGATAPPKVRTAADATCS